MDEVFFRDIKIYGFFSCMNVNYQKINQFTGRCLNSGENKFFGPRTNVVRLIRCDCGQKDRLLRFSHNSNRYFIGTINRHGATQ